MSMTAGELAERMSEVEFREHCRDLSREPDVAGKLDAVIALLWAIVQSNTSLAGSWIKGYEPPKVADFLPRWGKRKSNRRKPIDPSVVLAMVRSMSKSPKRSLSE